MEIPFQKLRLANGLELILHEDHADPVVAVYVYYHVGSSREEPHRSGFAHLFEHMLFQGSQHVGDDDHFRLIQEAGGTLNGTTNQDRTNYFETLPSNHLERALWLESDRMGFLLPAMTQAKLDNQRDVVMNERRQRYENRPYGLVFEHCLKALYPQGHPYSWPTIGSMEHIEAATLGDVAEFFERWYGPNNATLAIGGDFDPDEAIALVEKYFGPIPACPPVARPLPLPANLPESRYIVLEDKVALEQLTLIWPTVPMWHEDEAALNLLADVLSANKSSLFDKAMQIDEELASSVTISHHAGELAGMLTVTVRPHHGISLDRLRERIDELLAEFVQAGITDEQVARLKNRYEGGRLRSLETVSARTNALAYYNCFAGDPGRLTSDLDRHRGVTLEDLRRVARTWISERPRVLCSVVPEGRRDLAVPEPASETLPATPAPDFDRSVKPAEGDLPVFRSPEVWHLPLSNRLEVAGTPYDKIPLTRLALSVRAGRLQESVGASGLASLVAGMLEEGTRRLASTELQDVLDGLGATLDVSSDQDDVILAVSVLNQHLQEALELLREIVLEPRFDVADFARLKNQRLLRIRTREDRIGEVADDVFRALLFEGQPVLSAPSLGTEEDILALEVTDVRDHWERFASPARSKLLFVTDRSPDTIESALGSWNSTWRDDGASLDDERESTEQPALPERPRVIYLVDKPGAQQSEVRFGHEGVPRSHPDFYRLQVANHIFGGAFSSRINMNLREDKGFTYGARSDFLGARTLGTFHLATAVRTEDTADAVQEVHREFDRLERGFTAEELSFARRAMGQSLLRTYESTAAKLAMLRNVTSYGLEDDYAEQRLAWIKQATLEELDQLARRSMRAGSLIALVVGDRAAIEDPLRELGRGDVIVLDSQGGRLQEPAEQRAR